MSARPSGGFLHQYFRRHVGRRSAIVAARSMVELWSERGSCLATPKSRSLYPPLGCQHDVFRLHVAVDNAAVMRSR